MGIMNVLQRIMIVLVLLSMLISLGSAAPVPVSELSLPPSVNVATATANVTAVGSLSRLRPIQYLTTLFPTVRRCGGRRGSKCGGSSSPPSPPPPPGPTQIAQSLLLKNVNTSEYAGLYKVVVEAGWGISIGIYDEANRDWRLGVTATSSASNSRNGNCGMEVRFRATIPWNLHHRAESLSASAFCSGVAAAKEAMAKGSTIRVPNETDVTVLTTDVDYHEHGVDWVAVGIGIGFGVLLLVFLGIVLGAACGKA